MAEMHGWGDAPDMHRGRISWVLPGCRAQLLQPLRVSRDGISHHARRADVAHRLLRGRGGGAAFPRAGVFVPDPSRAPQPIPVRVRAMRALVLSLGLLLAAPPALAVFSEPPARPELAVLKERIETGEAAAAEERLRQLLAERPGDADVLNLLGYANRKLARYDRAREFYARALRIHPRHKGALEYMGELELETGDREAARALLLRLEEVCPEGCEELEDLRAAFARHGA